MRKTMSSYMPAPSNRLDPAQISNFDLPQRVSCPGLDNGFMSFDPASKPELHGLGQRRASLGMVVCMFIVLAGVIAVVGVLIAYGLMGTL